MNENRGLAFWREQALLSEMELIKLRHFENHQIDGMTVGEWATCTSKRIETAEAEATRLRGLVDLVNKYSKTRDIADRKAMFELAKELRDGNENNK